VTTNSTLRFEDFELDATGYTLRRRGRVVHLERRPMELLLALTAQPGELLTRQRLIEHLWHGDVFIDFETGLNTAVRKLRQALRDRPARSKFVETVAGKGYRFIAPLTIVEIPASVIRVAVLPFDLAPRESASAHIADGLTEETIASLAQINPHHLHVIGRTSAMAYRDARESLKTIGRALGVDFVVEGLLRVDGERLRISVALTRTSDETRVWSASYVRTLATLLDVQDALASAIAAQINVRANPSRLAHPGQRHSNRPSAYDAYLRGQRLWRQLTPQTTLMALQCFGQATEIDPHYALAWAAIAEANASSPINGDVNPKDAHAVARPAADRALRTGSELAEVQHVVGQVSWMLEWNWPVAEAVFRRAIALDASFAWSYSMLAHVLSQSVRHDEARTVMNEALTLEPLAPLHYAMSSQIAFQARDFSRALHHAQRAIDLNPTFWVGHMMRGQASEQIGADEDALAALDAAIRFSGGNSKPVSLRGYILAKCGRGDDARDVLVALGEAAHHRFVPPYAVALVHVGLGDVRQSLLSLQQAVDTRDVHLVFLPVDPKWDALRSNTHFADMIKACGFP
jgi:TolB-like protein/Flp pilus assembly protein TadD